MASTTTAVILFSVIIGIFAISTTARPCKTIFFITSTSSSSFFPSDTTNNPLQNPNSNPPRFTFFITEIHQFHRTTSFHHHHNNDDDDVVSSKPYFLPNQSIHDRTMDIMSIVGALLFGVGCGALTAGTIYLIWSLFSNRRLDFASSDDSDDSDVDEFEDDVSVKKNGYVAVPTVAKEVPPSADEVDAMK